MAKLDNQHKKNAEVTQGNDTETEKLKVQLEETNAKYLRALADYQNLERRVSQERQELKDRVVEEIMHSVLLFLDEIQRAEKHVNDSGLTHATRAFDATLARYHIKTIEVLNKAFDPHKMECVEVVAGTKDNEVIEQVRPGYFIGGKVLRPAWVKVSKKQSS